MLTHWHERLFRKVISVSIHSFIEWLDIFSYVLRPADVAVREVNRIRCFAIDIAKDLILLFCRLAMKNLCVLQLETALATLVTTWLTLADRRWRSIYRSVSVMRLGRQNATTGGSGNNLASVSLFSISFQWWRTIPKIFSKEGWQVRRRGTRLLILFSLYSMRSFLLFSLAFENPFFITLSWYSCLFKWLRKSLSLCLVVSTVEHIRFTIMAWLNGILLKQCLEWQLLITVLRISHLLNEQLFIL